MRGGTVADRVRTYTLVRALNLQILGATAGNRRDFEKDKTERGGPLSGPPLQMVGAGWLVHRTELVSVEIFFLNKSHRHHAVLLEAAIELAAIDSQCGCGPHLVATKLL